MKLYIPGPITVSEKTLQAMAKPMIGHRSKDFVALYESIQPKLQNAFYTKDPVYISTSSSWGVMEGALRNVSSKKVLNCMNGSFSDKWFDVAKRCGKEAEGLKFEWGKPVCPDAVRKALSTGHFDAITIIHSETSTGTLSPIEDLMAVIREFPEVISIVDTVSSFTTLPIKKDELGIDIMITGSQKALACPPGLSLISASKRALNRATNIEGRGYYFDLLEFQANWEKHMTPSTPVIPLIYALESKLNEMETETYPARYIRHKELNQKVRNWAFAKGFELFPEEKYGTIGLNCFKNTLNIDLPKLISILKAKHDLIIDGGYGKLKGQTFRISNMGDETNESITALLESLDSALKEL